MRSGFGMAEGIKYGVFHADGSLQNVLTGMGVPGRDPSLGYRINPYHRVPDFESQGLFYRTQWGIRRVVDEPPKYMCQNFGRYAIDGASDGKLAVEMNKYLDKLNIKDIFRRAQQVANLRGNAGVIVLVDDGEEDLSKPIQWNRVKAIEGFSRPISCRYLRPDTTDLWGYFSEDDKASKFYLSTTTFKLQTQAGKPIEIRQSEIHGDRVLWFRGSELDEDSRMRNEVMAGCDDSVIVNFLDPWLELVNGLASAARALDKMNTLRHGIDGLFDLLLNGGEEGKNQLLDRLRTNNLGLSTYRGVAYDKTRESIDFMNPSFGGVGEVLDRLTNHAIAGSGLAPSIFYQVFASGIDSSGKTHSEKQTLNASMRNLQDQKFRPILNDLFKIIHASKSAPSKGKEPEGWGWAWNDLEPESDAEKAQIQTQFATIDNQYLGLAANVPGLVAPMAEAILRTRFGSTKFNPDLTLDMDELMKKAEEIAKQEAEAQAAQFAPPEGEALPEETPPEEPIAQANDGTIAPEQETAEPV